MMSKLVLLCILLTLAVTSAQAQITGYDPRFIDIDGDVVVTPGDITCVPAGTPFTDWREKQLDGSLVGIVDGIGNQDGDILSPGSNLNPGSTLPKQDITRVWVSNNNQYLYLAEERRSNNGNSAWHVFMTKKSPTAVLGQLVVYHFQNGDMEIQICFPKGSDPAGKSIVVRMVSGIPDVSPGVPGTRDVIAQDIWTQGFWVPMPYAVAAFEVNASVVPALAGAYDSKGNQPANPTYDIACFAEAAISLFELGLDPCGSKAYATVITRSSCSLTSDLKDFAGPVLYSFGGPSVSEPEVTVRCGGADLSATATLGVPPYVIQWYDNDALIREIPLDNPPYADSYTQALDPGSHDIKVTVIDRGGSGCADTKIYEGLSVYDPVVASLSGTADCHGAVSYSASASGGDGNYTYAWEVDGQPVVGTGATYEYPLHADCNPHTIQVTVTDGQGCYQSASDTITQTVQTEGLN
jgi:hypothetical protein